MKNEKAGRDLEQRYDGVKKGSTKKEREEKDNVEAQENRRTGKRK